MDGRDVGASDREDKAAAGAPWLRLSAIIVGLLGLILLPFLLWGDAMDRLAPRLLETTPADWAVAGLGILLLAVDVLLPIPSSLVSASLALLLGPLAGAAAILAGMLASFSGGYLIGRLLPAARLRRWVGPRLWDALSQRARRSCFLWIAASRPVPVLAEATAVVAGSLGLPLRAAMLPALVSSTGVAACYAAAATLGASGGGFGLAFGVSLLLAGLLWWTSRHWQRRLLLPETVPASPIE